MLVYQFGCMTHYYKLNQFDKATMWRDKQVDYLNDTEVALGFKFFDPTQNFIKNQAYVNSKSIVDQNRHYLINSDMITGNIEYILESPGSMWEMFLASEAKKPVLTFGDISEIKSPHILNCITQHFHTLEDMCEYMIDMYSQRE